MMGICGKEFSAMMARVDRDCLGWGKRKELESFCWALFASDVFSASSTGCSPCSLWVWPGRRLASFSTSFSSSWSVGFSSSCPVRISLRVVSSPSWSSSRPKVFFSLGCCWSDSRKLCEEFFGRLDFCFFFGVVDDGRDPARWTLEHEHDLEKVSCATRRRYLYILERNFLGPISTFDSVLTVII